MRFVVFEDAQRGLQKFITNKNACNFLAGGFAGFCSVMFNNPIDVIKTQMQKNEGGNKLGFMGTANDIVAQRGIMGFYSGVVPRLARVVLDAALTFSIFHGLKARVITYLEK